MRRFYSIIILNFLFILIGFAQPSKAERIPVVLKVSRLPQLEMDIIVRDSMAYLPVRNMFDFIGIYVEIDSVRAYVQGFYRHPDSTFSIDVTNGIVKKRNRSFAIGEDDAIVEQGDIYLRTDFLYDFLNIGFKYNPRLLTVTIDSPQDLSILKYFQRQQKFQTNKRRTEFVLPPADYVIDYEPWKTGAGLVSWNIFARKTGEKINTNYYFSTQSKIIGGDLDLSLRGITRPRRTYKPILRGQYRIPLPDNNSFKQIILGQRFSNSLLPYDVLGIEVNNRPLAARSVHDRELISSATAPNSNVELLSSVSGNQYAEPKDDGRYSFDVPLRYGYNPIQIISYDRYGRFYTRSHNINIPTSMIPTGEVDYSIFFGKLTHLGDQYVTTNYINAGVSSRMTIGGMLDYYGIKNLSQKWYPAITGTGHILDALNLTGIVSPGSYSRLNVRWLPSPYSELSITRSYFGRRNPFNFGRARNGWEFLASTPLVPGNELRISVDGEHTQFDNYQNYIINGSLYGFFGKISPNITSRIIRSDVVGKMNTISHLTDVGAAAILPLNVLFNANISYNHISHDLQSLRVSVAKTVVEHLNIRLSAQRFPTIPLGIITLDIRYVFPFLDVKSTISRNDVSSTYGLNLLGSVGFNIPTASFNFNSMASKREISGFELHPFVDANNNNKRDEGETTVEGGRIYLRDNTLGLPALALGKNKFKTERLRGYKSYSIYLDPTSLDDPSIVPKYRTIQFFSESNYIRDIDLALVYGGTIRGTVVDSVNNPMEGVTVILTPILPGVKDTSKLVRKTSTFSTGEYEFTLLSPGRYKIEIDPVFISTYIFKALPNRREIALVSKPEGDVIENQNFQMIKR